MADDVTNGSAGNSVGESVDDFDLPLSADEGPPGSGSGSGAQSPAGDGTTTEQQPTPESGEQFPSDLTDALRREGLRPVPGETTMAAYSRLSQHLNGKAVAYGRQIRAMEQAQAAEIQQLRQGLEPMLRDYYQRRHMAQVEEQEAQIPPKDSPEYQVWLNEQILARMEARERQEWESAQEWEQRQAEEQFQGQLQQVDEAGFGKVAEGLGLVQGKEADPEFSHAYDVFSTAAVSAARDFFPTATDQQIQEFVALSQRLDIRRAEMNGVDIRQVMKSRLNGIIGELERRGLVQRTNKAATGAPNGEGSSGGNGKVAAGARPQPPQPTAQQRVAADAAAGARRAPLSTPAATRPTQLPGQLPDPAAFDNDDDYVEAALAGILGSEEQRTAGHRKTR